MEISIERMKAVVVKAFKEEYTKFDGRVSKNDFWNFLIAMAVLGMAVSIVASILGKFGSILSIIWSLGTLLPNISMGIRRLHDTGKPGLYILICLIPCIGAILYLVQAWQEGVQEENEFGPVPEDTVAMAE